MKTKFYLATFLLFCLINLSAQNNSYDLYILIGQSNMAGRGKIEAQDTVVHKRVLTLNKNNEWVPAKDPIHFDKKVAGVGLGRTYGIEMAKANPQATIGLIPCAVGGSGIDTWKPGGYHQQTKLHPWDDMEKRVNIAMQNGTIKGILWHQGESDSHPDKCYTYKQKLEDLVKRIRFLANNPDLPFVAGELGKFKIKGNRTMYNQLQPAPAEVVIQATKEVTGKDINAAFVSSKGLKHKGDNTHFGADSYRKLGKRYAKAMQKLQQK
jgi:hypothetical protein